MCDAVVMPDGSRLSTVAHLIARGWTVCPADWGMWPTGTPDPAASCLCCVDVDAVLDRAGVEYDYDIEGVGWMVTG